MPVATILLGCISLMALVSSGLAQVEGNATCATVAQGGLVAAWQSRQGVAVSFRGRPLVLSEGEFTLHRAWQDVYYKNAQGGAVATVESSDAETVLTASDRTDRFWYTKRIHLRQSGVRFEYEYGLTDLDSADLQVLFPLDAAWFADADYAMTAGGQVSEGKVELPASGRVDPWSGVTAQRLTTSLGTLSISAQTPLNFYLTPKTAALWWALSLERDKAYTQVIDFTIDPGPDLPAPLVGLTSLSFPGRVHTGTAQLAMRLVGMPGVPSRVGVRVEPMSGRGPAVDAGEVEMGTDPTEVSCDVPMAGDGLQAFRATVTAPDGGTLLEVSPLLTESVPNVRIRPRYSLYMGEPEAEAIVDLAPDLDLDGLMLTVSAGSASRSLPVDKRRMRVSVPIAELPDGASEVVCSLMRGEEVLGQARTAIRKAPPRADAVRIDNLSRGLIVDGLPFFPFGFYCYWPINRVLDEEVVHGFNLLSPYQGGPHDAAELEQIRAYLDRAAAIGMKVNYQIMWAYATELTDDDIAKLRAEVEMLRDHPAVLAWYTADEPSVEYVDRLTRVHNIIKELDPYHPISVVFYQGGEHARQFRDAMDIVMADPYPIPNGPVTTVANMAEDVGRAQGWQKPLWIVPQAFGGGEAWPREPTAREQRVMTYLSLVHGATAIQYFIRAPRVSFPKSPVMWAECGALALETAELTPFLLSTEEKPEARCPDPTVHVSAWRDRGVIAVLAVNTDNAPKTVRVELPGLAFTGEAEVLFEDRRVPVTDGVIEEPIDAFGTRAYGIPVGPELESDVAIDPGNLTRNPSFEELPQVGTADGQYASMGDGATAFADSRVARHGRHSLRLIAPTDDQLPRLSPFPVTLEEGRTYRLSLWAKAREDGVELRLSCTNLGEQDFALTTEWQECVIEAKAAAGGRSAPSFSLASKGTAWVDLFQVAPVE